MPGLIGKHYKLLVLGLIIVGVAIRSYYFYYPLNRSSEITVDEAVYGIQAERIMDGERPVFYPAQDYTGSFSAYVSALVFTVFGISVWGLKIVPLLFSFGTIWMIYLLALRIFDQKVAIFVLLVASLGTPFWNNWSSRAGTGYVEATFIGSSLLYLAVKLVQGGSTPITRAKYFLIIGFLSGFGFWVQPTIVYFVIPSLMYLLISLRKKFFTPFAFFCLGFVVGCSPVIYYNFSIRPSGTVGALFKKPWGIRGAIFKLAVEGFPVLLGGRTSNSTVDFSPVISALIYGIFLSALAYFANVVYRLRSSLGPELLLALTFITTITVFVFSAPFNQLSMEPRYVFSLYVLLPIIFGLFFERVSRLSMPVLSLLLGIYLLNSLLGLFKAGPLIFLDSYSFSPLVTFLRDRHINYIISTPATGHRASFFSNGSIKAAIRGGGITEARFEAVNFEVNKALSLEPRLVAYVSLNNEPNIPGFRAEAGSKYLENYAESVVDNNFRVIYSNK